MHKPHQHEMQLEVRYSTGAEEWCCPTCGRRLIVMPPCGSTTLALERGAKYILVWGPTIGIMTAAKILLEPGDEQALHHGTAISADVEPELADIEAGPCAENMSVWEEWLDDVDLGDF